MRVGIGYEGIVRLDEAEDFARFSVAPDFQPDQLASIGPLLAPGIVFEGSEVAWIATATVEGLAKRCGGEWKQSFDAMLEKVRPFGWYSHERRMIRAHVVWPDGRSSTT